MIFYRVHPVKSVDANLDTIHIDAFKKINRFLDLPSKKSLRRVNWRLYEQVDQEREKNPFTCWKIPYFLKKSSFSRFVEDVFIIKELYIKLFLELDELEDCINLLFNKHNHITVVGISIRLAKPRSLAALC